MEVTPSFQFAKISDGGYRHFPLLYLAYGKDGFMITIIGCSLTVKF